jgi:metallo-beta-lactamase class B
MDENIKHRMYGGTFLDFKKTLDRLEDFKVDIWLGSHPNHNNTFQKLELMKKNVEPNPFKDPKGWKNFIKEIKLEFQRLSKK